MEQTFSPFGTSYETLPDIKVITASDIIFCTPLHNHVLYFAPKVESLLSFLVFVFLSSFFFFFFSPVFFFSPKSWKRSSAGGHSFTELSVD